MTSPPPSSSDFYLHEDEWGMISLEPEENRFELAGTMTAAAEHGEAHRAPGGIGWTALYVAPAPSVELAARAIALADVIALVGSEWTRHANVISGYSTYREPVDGAYALACGDVTLYGSAKAGIVQSLCLTRGAPHVADVLYRLGATYRLILSDLWQHAVVELGDRDAIARYLADDDVR